MRRLNHLSYPELVRFHRIAYQLFTKYGSERSWHRLERVIVALDNMQFNREVTYEKQ